MHEMLLRDVMAGGGLSRMARSNRRAKVKRLKRSKKNKRGRGVWDTIKKHPFATARQALRTQS